MSALRRIFNIRTGPRIVGEKGREFFVPIAKRGGYQPTAYGPPPTVPPPKPGSPS